MCVCETPPSSGSACSDADSCSRPFVAGPEQGLVILGFRAPVFVSAVNVFRGFWKNSLAFLKTSSFLPHGLQYTVLCLSGRISIISFTTDGNNSQCRWRFVGSAPCWEALLVFSKPVLRPWISSQYSHFTDEEIHAQKSQVACLNSMSQNLSWLLSSICLVLHYHCFHIWTFSPVFPELLLQE